MSVKRKGQGFLSESEEHDSDNNTNSRVKPSGHDRWKRIRRSRKCTDFSDMSYWEVVSKCTIL
jgi:hypothetical protein